MDSRSHALLGLALPLALVACADDAQPSTPAPIAIEQSDAAAPTRQAPLVVFLGDSLTAGNGLAEGQAFPALIQRRLAAEGRALRIVNAGVSGDTSAGGLARLDWMLQQKPDIVVVALGANDGLRGLPVSELESNLNTIIERVQQTGARVLLAGMLMPPNYGEDYARDFAAVYPRVAKANNVALVPFLLEGVGGRSELNLADGMHPNAAGQAILAENVLKGLSGLLAKK